MHTTMIIQIKGYVYIIPMIVPMIHTNVNMILYHFI